MKRVLDPTAAEQAHAAERAHLGLVDCARFDRARPLMLLVGRLYEAMRFLSKALLVIALSASVTGHVDAVADTVEGTFDLSGYYFPIRRPRAFRDLDCIELHRNDLHDSPGGPISVTVLMNKHRHRIYRHRWRLYTRDRLRFATVARAGIHFEFEGWFAVTPKDVEHGMFLEGESHNPRAVLMGTLTKLDGDTVLASERISFYYTGGD